jgi:predicted nuclease with TOPRIM domain
MTKAPPANQTTPDETTELADAATTEVAPKVGLVKENKLPSGYEVVATTPALAEEVKEAEQFGESLTALQNLITHYSERFDKLSEDLKQIRESMRNLLDNNQELQEAEQKAKNATMDVKTNKQKVKSSPEAVQFQMKMKEVQDEINEVKGTLNNHLVRYFQMTGSQVIEEPDGSEREFSLQARLKKAKKPLDE